MNILVPDSWLREYLKTPATPGQLKDCLSLCGPSVERINWVGRDAVYDIEITTNRIDMAGVYGIAREAAAILPRFGIKAELKEPVYQNPPLPTKKVPLDISDPAKICNRILGIVMDVSPIKPAPDYMKDRIEKSGVRSLNNLVDITNYVMLEIGHPCHVFDYDRVGTGRFIIRNAHKNEPIITLDGRKYLLDSEDVIIDDGTGKVIDLPGIMGTENSVVNKNTKRIIFFIESNNPVLIRRTSMRYGIRTMAASINEKHPDPQTAENAFLTGIRLYREIAGGVPVSPVTDIYPNHAEIKRISVQTDFINERLGVTLDKKEMARILQSLSFKVNFPGDRTLEITPPAFRQFDINLPEDIVEEIARIYGYHNLPSRLMTGAIPLTPKPRDLAVEEKIKHLLKYWGFTETCHYSFISGKTVEKGGLKKEDNLRISNPLTEETEFLRSSLLPSLLETVASNQPFSDKLSLFELSKVYIPVKNDLPQENSRLAVAVQTDFFSLKGVIQQLLDELGIENYREISASGSFFHPNQSLSLSAGGSTLVTLGLLHPEMARNFSVKNKLYIADMDTDLLLDLPQKVRNYKPIPAFPKVIEDISVTCPPKTLTGPLIGTIKTSHPDVQSVVILDRYQDSVTLRITYQNINKNLDQQDIQAVRKKILDVLKSKYQAVLKQ